MGWPLSSSKVSMPGSGPSLVTGLKAIGPRGLRKTARRTLHAWESQRWSRCGGLHGLASQELQTKQAFWCFIQMLSGISLYFIYSKLKLDAGHMQQLVRSGKLFLLLFNIFYCHGRKELPLTHVDGPSVKVPWIRTMKPAALHLIDTVDPWDQRAAKSSPGIKLELQLLKFDVKQY